MDSAFPAAAVSSARTHAQAHFAPDRSGNTGLRVVQVVASLHVGGAERVAVEVAVGVANRGLASSVLVAGPAEPNGQPFVESHIRTELQERGVALHCVPFSGISSAASRRALADFLQREHVDIVHVHNRPQDWQTVAVCLALGIPAIYTRHSHSSLTKTQTRLLYGACGRAVPRIVCVSESVASQVRHDEFVPKHRLQVIHNGVPMHRFAPMTEHARASKRADLGWADDDFVWLCAARLHTHKGHVFLLDAMATLPPQSRARLMLAGDGPLQDEIMAQAARLGLGDRVSFLGPRQDVPELLGAADGYACSSRQEGHPLALLEAMAMQLVVVAPRLRSIEEIACEGSPIFFGPPLDWCATQHDPKALAAALLFVEDHRESLRDNATGARDHVAAKYSLQSMIDAHVDLYEELTATRRRHPYLQALTRQIAIRSVLA